MTATTESSTTLATREFTDQQIRTRLNAANKPGFGLEKATPDQLNMIYLLAKHYDVDPSIDITLFRDQPFFTIDGRVRIMRRHPQYAGYRTRPLTKDEKDAWGYKPDEIVVECTIRTRDWGDIVARGKVSPDEFNRQPVARSHPQEMAEKRAIARASRMAFGQDVPDEDEVAHLVVERVRPTPAQLAAGAAQYDRIMGNEDDGTQYFDQPQTRPAAPPEQGARPPAGGTPAPAEPAGTTDQAELSDAPESATDAALERNAELQATARELGVKGLGQFKANAAWSAQKVDRANTELEARVRSRNGDLDTSLAAEQAQAF